MANFLMAYGKHVQGLHIVPLEHEPFPTSVSWKLVLVDRGHDPRMHYPYTRETERALGYTYVSSPRTQKRNIQMP